MEEAKYFLQSQGELALGPFTLAELAGKGLMNSTLLYSTDRGEWIPVDQIPEVADLVRKESESKAHECAATAALELEPRVRGASGRSPLGTRRPARRPDTVRVLVCKRRRTP